MASDESTTVENEALLEKIEAIEKEVAAINEALISGRRTRRLLLLALIAFLVGFSGLFYRMQNKFRSKENIDLLVKLASERLTFKSDSYIREVRTLIDKASPVITEAFVKQVKKDWPELTDAVGVQRDLLIKNLRSRLEEQIKDHYGAAVEKHKAILEDELKDLDDPETMARMVKNLQAAFDKLLEKYYVDELTSELNTMYDTWQKFPLAEPAAEGQPALEDQLVHHLLVLLTIQLEKYQAKKMASNP